MINFNPRTPQGGATLLRWTTERTPNISIHAPRKGVRPAPLALENPHVISIHAPRKGVRRYGAALYSSADDFNPRTPQGGATIGWYLARGASKISIHAPRKGVRLISVVYFSPVLIFQSTHPARGCDSATKIHHKA